MTQMTHARLWRRFSWAASAALLLTGLLWLLNTRDETAPAGPPGPDNSAALLARGEYISRAGNCMSCHTVPGGAPYAGGRGIDTFWYGVLQQPHARPRHRPGELEPQ